MRTLWNIVSFLAIVHLLALLMFIAWLWHTHRLSAERMMALRDLFAPTVLKAQLDKLTEKSAADKKLRMQIEAGQRADPSLDSELQIRYVSLIKQQEEQSRRRLEAEKKMLIDQLAAASAAVQLKSQELERLRTAWDGALRKDRERNADEQFLQTVKQYEQIAPRQGKKMIMELIGQEQFETAVSYLDAMNPRAANKILKEFKTDQEIVLATQLLERLRTH